MQARLTVATEGAREREAAAAREHSEAAAALGRELGAARERLASVSAELEQVRRSSQLHAHMLARFYWFCWFEKLLGKGFSSEIRCPSSCPA